MPTRFPGFSPKALTFFRQLAKNNDRAWFEAHREQYTTLVYEPMIELVGRVGEQMRSFAADYVREPKRALYRIYRDTRFSHDKTPFKDHLGAQFQHPRVTKNLGAGFYFHVNDRELSIAGGIYMPGPEELLAVRSAFIEQELTVRKLLADRALRRAMGEPVLTSAARVPKAYPPDSPAGDLLKLKQLYFSVDLPTAVATSPKVEQAIVSRFKLLAPLIQFLNGAILAKLDEEPSEVSTTPRRPEPMF